MFYALTTQLNSTFSNLIAFDSKAERGAYFKFYGKIGSPITSKEKTVFLKQFGTHYGPLGNPIFDKKAQVNVRWF